MSNPQLRPVQAANPQGRVEIVQVGNLPLLVYVLYLAGYLTCGLTAVAGLVLAYLSRGSGNAVERSHYDHQIRTFWWGLPWVFIGSLLTMVFVGYLLLLGWFVWSLTRCLTGIFTLNDREPILR